jgi:hypothetical protein
MNNKRKMKKKKINHISSVIFAGDGIGVLVQGCHPCEDGPWKGSTYFLSSVAGWPTAKSKACGHTQSLYQVRARNRDLEHRDRNVTDVPPF